MTSAFLFPLLYPWQQYLFQCPNAHTERNSFGANFTPAHLSDPTFSLISRASCIFDDFNLIVAFFFLCSALGVVRVVTGYEETSVSDFVIAPSKRRYVMLSAQRSLDAVLPFSPPRLDPFSCPLMAIVPVVLAVHFFSSLFFLHSSLPTMWRSFQFRVSSYSIQLFDVDFAEFFPSNCFSSMPDRYPPFLPAPAQ